MRALSFLIAGGLAWTAAALPAAAQKKPVTLEAIERFGRPPAGGPGMPAAWMPDGKSFLYRDGKKVMRYDIASKSASELLNTEAMENAAVKVPPPERFDWENRGVREASLAVSPSGKELMLSLGGDLFLWREGGGWDQLTKTPVRERDPKLSPDGKRIAFRRDWDLYVVDLETKKETRLTKNGSDLLRNGGLDWVYPEELSLSTAYWWSPDSKSIAYLQFDTGTLPVYPHADLLKPRAVAEPQRYPQAGEPNSAVRLGVVPATGGPTRWLDAGETRDANLIARVGWMPGGNEVWVLRTTRIQDALELFTIDPKSGAQRTILKETDPHWVNLNGEPRFLKDGKRFLWLSERDGFKHIYLYTADGRDARQLTRGNWQVNTIAGVDEERERIYYTSTEASPLESQLYRVDFQGRTKVRLSNGAGTHSVSMSPDAGVYLDTYSSLQSPPRTTLHAADGAELTVYRPADTKAFEEFELLPTELHELTAADGRSKLYARLIKPAGFDPSKKYPAVVQVYGGPHAQNVRNAWAGPNWDQVLAHKGFVIWQLDNRGTSGRGHAFETPVHLQLGVVELEDQKKGVEYLVGLGFVDPKRIGVNGWSYGGFMTLNCMFNAPDTFAAGIAGASVTDWNFYDTIYTERYMSTPQLNPEGYKKTALAQSAGKLKGKLMLIHNLGDDNVLFQNVLTVTDALQRAGKQFEFMLYPQKAHGVTGPAARQMRAAMTDFFERTLLPGR